MTDNISAEIVAVGTEILLGEITDTNSVYIARVLRDLGINLYFMTSVGDNERRIAQAIRSGLERADVIIVCGGLGPTVDDMTRQGIALATNRQLTLHEDLLEAIRERFKSFHATMTKNNYRQAYLPEDSIPIKNSVGTAPGFIVESGNGIVISLPGVPREMKYLMQQTVVPYLRSKYQLGIIKARILKTAGIGESMLDDMLGEELLNASNPTIGLAAHHGIIDIRITAKAETNTVADQLLNTMETSVRSRAGQYIFGVGDDAIETALAQMLIVNSIQLSLLEVGIDTTIGTQLIHNNFDGEIAIKRESYTDYQPLIEKQEISADCASRKAAVQLATNRCTQGCASIVVISDPNIDEGADTDEVTVVSVCFNGETRTRGYGFGGRSHLAREWGSRWAMAVLWQMLQSVYRDAK